MVILGHEDDSDNSENCNLHLHDYEALGLKIRSLQSMYFHTFLSYKPEQLLLEGNRPTTPVLDSMLISDS